MPLHDLKSSLEIEFYNCLTRIKSNVDLLELDSLELDVFSISTDPIEFYFGFFNLMNGLYAPTTPPPSESTSKNTSINFSKIPKSPIHYLDIDCIREIVQFMLQMDVSHFTSGLVFITKSLVEDIVIASNLAHRNRTSQSKDNNHIPSLTPKEKVTLKTRFASALANQMLIQITAMAFPDLFFGRNEVDAPDSPAKQVFRHYQKHLAAGKGVGNVLLWICCQQSFSLANGRRVVHPKCLEVWFSYFYPLLSVNTNNTWDKKSALSFIDVVLDNLIKQPSIVQYDSMDLAVIPMPTFSSLFNAVFLQPQSQASSTHSEALKKIYRKLKHLMFLSDRAKIITSPPLQILTTLLAPLPHLSKSTISYQECVDLLANLIASQQLLPGYSIPTMLGKELMNSWVSCFGDYTKETAILVEYLIEKSKPSSYWSGDSVLRTKLRKSELSIGMKKISDQNKILLRSFKKSQPHLSNLHPRLKVLATLSQPPSSFPHLVFKTSLQTFLFLFCLFFMYALIYIQCDLASSRVCPLPFNPHILLETFQNTVVQGILFLSMVLKMTINRIILEWNSLISYFQVMVKQVDHWTVSFFFEFLVQPCTNGLKNVYESSGGMGPRLVHFWVMEFKKVGMMVHRNLGELIDMGMKTWHFSAIVFVDQYVPIILSEFTKLIGWIHGYGSLIGNVVEEYRVEVGSMEIVKQIRGHWIYVLIWEWYLMYIDPLVSRLGLFVHVVYNRIMEGDWDLVVRKGEEALQSIISKLKI